jgi:alkylation response protein AidB-like acyl-CoA dehydrogenase
MLQANTLCPLLAKYGNEDIHERFLKPLLNGTTVGCLAVTEPSGGSAIIDAVQCRATDGGDDWIITGEKMFITNAPIADLAILLARTSARPGAFSFTLIAVPIDTSGVTVSARLQTLGLKSSPTGKLQFDACQVPKTNTIGGVGKGYIQFTDIIREERLMIAAVAVALARLCLTDTIHAFRDTLSVRSGGSIIRNELTRYHIDIESAHSFINSVTARMAQGQNAAVLASAAKFHLVELAQRTISRCLELRGSDAKVGQYPLEQAYRDSRVWSVYAGTSETMRDHVGRYLLPDVRPTL